MNESELSSARRRFIRKGSILFGAIFCPIVTFAFFDSVSGSLIASIFFYIVTLTSAIYISYLWGCLMWKVYEKRIIKAYEVRAMKDRSINSASTVHRE
jgi:hypothetical protein